MQFCEDHWTRMREAVAARGLDHLVARDGKEAAARIRREIEQGEQTKETFDPLMAIHWSIAGTVMDTLGKNLGAAAAVSVLGDVCPLCHINRIHKESCREEGCTLDRERGFDWMIDRAADDAFARAKELGLMGLPA